MRFFFDCVQFVTELVIEESLGKPSPTIPLVLSTSVTLDSVIMPVTEYEVLLTRVARLLLTECLVYDSQIGQLNSFFSHKARGGCKPYVNLIASCP